MVQRLPLPLTEVETGKTSKKSLNENRQIAYSLYQTKEITKKTYNIRMDTIYHEFRKMTDKYTIILNL